MSRSWEHGVLLLVEVGPQPVAGSYVGALRDDCASAFLGIGSPEVGDASFSDHDVVFRAVDVEYHRNDL